jgi:hypothetical protein
VLWIHAVSVAFMSGFAIMVLEIIGARLLARYFGSSLYVWTSQIGMVLVALTLGYLAGGALADRFRRLNIFSGLLFVGAAFTACIPWMADPLMDAIVTRHPLEQDIPALWRRIDPALGSALIFLPPCFVLATLPPSLIRNASGTLGRVGRVSGTVYGAGSAGSIAGVFLSGYVLLDLMSLPEIFQATGGLMFLIAILCLLVDAKSREHEMPIVRAD